MSELEECERLLAQATYPAVRKLLEQHIQTLKVHVVPPKPPASSDAQQVAGSSSGAISSQAPQTRKPTAGMAYIPIENFAWDQGEYNSPLVSIFIDLPGVGAIKDQVDFSCTATSFDLKINGLEGKNYRLVKDNLDKDIVPSESKIIVKKDKIVVKLQKKKGEYSYEHWTSLTSKKPRNSASEAERKKDPTAGLMDMMKEMYDDGDENMKKIIGEAMMKSRSGAADKQDPSKFDDL
jgi:calcyclin binding protein